MKYLLLITYSLLFFSCSSSQYVQINDSTGAQQDIPIYFTNDLPQEEYEVLGFIETSGWIFTTNKALIRGMRKKATKVKADAIINAEFGHIPHLGSGLPAVTGLAVKWKNNDKALK